VVPPGVLATNPAARNGEAVPPVTWHVMQSVVGVGTTTVPADMDCVAVVAGS
jgi:hypothetical protein